MSCPEERTLGVYVDGELSREDAEHLEGHLRSCSSCRDLVEGLRREARLLTEVLGWVPTQPADRGATWPDRVTSVLLLFAAAAGVEAFLRWLTSIGEQAPLDAVDKWSFVMSALIEALFFLLREGALMLTSLLNFLAVVMLLAGVTVGVVVWRRRTAAPFLLLAFLLASAGSSHALEFRTGDKETGVNVRAGETIDDSLYTAADALYLDGVVTGNVVAVARRVIVRGTVKGDLVTLAQRVEISGNVEGNVLSVSENFTLHGPVGQSLHAFAESLTFDKSAIVRGDALTFAKQADLEGQINRDLLAFAGIANLRSDVARNAIFGWADRLSVEKEARIGGNLTAHVDDKLHVRVDPGANITGKTETLVSRKAKAHKMSWYARPSFYVWKAIWLFAAFITGLVLEWLSPSLFTYPLIRPGAITRSAVVGFIALSTVPLAALLLGLTLIGLPLGLLLVCAWVAGIYLSGILVSVSLGRFLLARSESTPPPAFALALILGLVVLSVAREIPYLGLVLRLAVVVVGLGMGLLQTGRMRRGSLPVGAA